MADNELQTMAVPVITINEEIAALNKQIRELRKEKRERSKELLAFMVQHDIREVQVGSRKIMLDQNLTFL